MSNGMLEPRDVYIARLRERLLTAEGLERENITLRLALEHAERMNMRLIQHMADNIALTATPTIYVCAKCGAGLLPK